ncbi:sensor histidine kinase [Aquimarina agarilytica]|uniref:sensor histidine kinase n=1 Tax=Aquimarina agarilytica TaxID=1087449 RepID=UPI0002880801|nr:ATP-binding protein [Aquimarina agarilytica]
MITQQYIDANELMSQLSAVSVRLDIDYKICSIAGDTSEIGVHSFELYQNLFDFLPVSLIDSVKENLQKSFRTNKKVKTNVNYIGINNKQKRLKVISSIIAIDTESFYLVTFLKLPVTDNIVREINGYESYEEARRKLEISEAKFNYFFENDPVMHINVNPETGLIADCNKFVVQKLELENKNAIIGNPIYKIFTEEKKERCLALLEKFKAEGELKSEEMELITTKGKIIPVILYTVAQRDEYGKIILSRSTLVDITDLKNAQKRLNQKRIRLELLNKELEQFVSTCSHDLQEPLATIKFAGDVLGKLYKDKFDQKGRDYLMYIDEAVDRLTKQIRSLLAHSRIGVNAERSFVNTNDLVNTAIKDLGKRISENKAEVVVDKLPMVEAYGVELRLVFLNLISNAIKYRKKNRIPKIKIGAAQCNDYVMFSVADNGIGISKEDSKEIFKIFNRVNETNPNKGTGVGLAHCDKIVRMHEGKLWVESNVDKGSTFFFKIRKQYVH